MTRSLALVITCEHGGNRLPRAYEYAFSSRKRLLASHRGLDHGALDMARYLARELEAPLEFSTVTRLLVDLNRSVGHRDLYSEAVRSLDAATKRDILHRFYHPHRERVEQRVAGLVARGKLVVHVASHSFTPTLDGTVRNADVACLYHPGRRREKRFCNRWLEELSSLAPELRLRRNYPYRGRDDGLTQHLRSVFPTTRYLGVELEVNQSHFLKDRTAWRQLRAFVATALAAATAASES